MAVNFSGKCSACGKSHEFHIPGADFVNEGEPYYFNCPDSGDDGTVLGPAGWHKVGQGKPPQVIVVRERP